MIVILLVRFERSIVNAEMLTAALRPSAKRLAWCNQMEKGTQRTGCFVRGSAEAGACRAADGGPGSGRNAVEQLHSSARAGAAGGLHLVHRGPRRPPQPERRLCGRAPRPHCLFRPALPICRCATWSAYSACFPVVACILSFVAGMLKACLQEAVVVASNCVGVFLPGAF